MEHRDTPLVRRQPAGLWTVVTLLFCGPLNAWLLLIWALLLRPEQSWVTITNGSYPELWPLMLCGSLAGLLVLIFCGRRTTAGPILWGGMLAGLGVAVLYTPALALIGAWRSGVPIVWDELLMQETPSVVMLGSWIWSPMAVTVSLVVRLLAYRREARPE